MSITRQQIQDDVLAYLNRAGDTTLLEATWFVFAHRAIQQLHNFKAMELTASITLVSGTDEYTAPTGLKKPITAYFYKTSTGKVVKFLNKTNVQTLRQRRLDTADVTNIISEDYETFLYEWYAGQILIWPPVVNIISTADKLRLDTYTFLEPPAVGASDWFTDNARDYLMYASLLESVPFLGAPADRIKTWREASDAAFRRIMGFDLDAAIDGPLQIRG